MPFFQQSIKNPYYAETNKETLDQEVTDTSDIDSKTFKGLDSDMKGQSKSEQKTPVEAENMSESESDETVITKEDIIRLTRPAKRKTMMKKENINDKKRSQCSAEWENSKVNIKTATVDIEMEDKEVVNQIETKNKKSWRPPFIPVCWKIGCRFCEAKKCEVCVKCVSKERCVWRDCPRLKETDSTENNNIKSDNGDQSVNSSRKECRSPSDEENLNNNANSPENLENIDEVRFKCSKCNKHFTYLKSLNDHKCGSKYNKITCPSCSKLISSTNYSRHIKLHSISKFKCSKCAKHFISKIMRDNHEKFHADNNCGLCGMNFRRPSELKKHLISHGSKQQPESASNQKFVTCKVCNAELSSLRVLGIHMQTFHKDKALSCDICRKLVFSKRVLREHKKKHKSSESVEHQEKESTNSYADNTTYLVEENDGQINVGESGDNVFVTLQNDDDVEVLQNIIFVSTEESSVLAEHSVGPSTNIQTELNYVDY